MDTEHNTIQDVQKYLNSGQIELAIASVKKVLKIDAENIFCLSVLAKYEYENGNLEKAKEILVTALKISPTEVNLNRSLGLIENKLSNFRASFECFLSCIVHFKMKGDVLLDLMFLAISGSKLNEPKAVEILEWVFNQSNSFKFAYLNQKSAPLLQEASKIANIIVRDYRYKQQKAEIDAICLGFSLEQVARIKEFLDVFHGLKLETLKNEGQKPTYYSFPDLNSTPFLDSSDFEWSKDLEKNSMPIKHELEKLFENEDLIRPYIDGVVTGNEGLDELSDSYDWSSIHLIKGGRRIEKLLAQCPTTRKVIDSLPLSELEGNGPEVFLSVLKPGAVIKPHYGLSNIKLTVHLGLNVPSENCEIMVNGEIKSWENGKVLIFDDTFEHSAWNNSNQNRYVLILEVWHPDLSEVEKQALQKFQFMQNKIQINTAKHNFDSILGLAKSV